ncbi:hypothetical protein GH714_003224 [Hevea brasiliensis]|uniref:Uncharacterized protein n=1 Tax=Hevea brasiliensis TaxID=3981 RepID=A0A6A6KZT4_HEVBR|nr:hypothetical protein GH714_003224 [Hevea brasiliensis]
MVAVSEAAFGWRRRRKGWLMGALFAPIIKEESALMAANADMNMLNHLGEHQSQVLLESFLLQVDLTFLHKPAWNLVFAPNNILENGGIIEPRNVKPEGHSLCSFAAAGTGVAAPYFWNGCQYCIEACPICRKLSYFVVPSVLWSIDCKYFDFGNGNCPFGTSCFTSTCAFFFFFFCFKQWLPYICLTLSLVVLNVAALGHVLSFPFRDYECAFEKSEVPCIRTLQHAYEDGRVEEVASRHLGAEDGNTVIAKNIRLSDFLGSLQIS